ncbi:calcium-activated potassium channel slo-1-like isoform X2 [Paramacrobiotus metropolitanus]|nr:calcium-activated potassium channel slo-1-like isoform X2 [Paramacrobiotus metropolitanus]
MYFFLGIGVPLFALFLINFKKIKNVCLLKIRKGFTCKRATADAETEEKAEIAEELNIEAPAVDRLEQLAQARANRSKLDIFLAEASSPQAPLGQVLMGIGVLCSAVSLSIYLVKVSSKVESLEICGTLPNAYQVIDLCANLYMLCFFVIRLAGSDRKQKVITSMFSVVDYFTIPSVVLGVILNRYFTGFAFFRAYNFQWLVEILAHRRILRSTNSVRLAKLIFLVFAIIIIAGGFLHVAENMGDPWLYDVDNVPLYNGQAIVFFRCFLYVYGRITLLDLSGMRMYTMLGRVIIYIFQILALGIVARAIPQIIERVKLKPDYDKKYTPSPMFLHIIVCGHVRASAMEAFLKEFYHPDRDISEFFKIVILSEEKPDEIMESLQERYFSRLDYLRGTVMSLKDLARVNLVEARAVLIIADRTAADTDAEDAANIMRVVSIKNYKDDAQVIVQITQYHNKAYLQNIPSWNPENGDICICLAELRLGLLAQSCLAPGFSTLMANFFTSRTYDPNKKFDEDWQRDYVQGTALELYCRPFGDAFVGMTFAQACEFCYRRLKIVLLAIQADPSDITSMPQINPLPTTIILPGTCGYFIAADTLEADRAQYYCPKCHVDVEDVQLIKKCSCRSLDDPDHDSLREDEESDELRKIAHQQSVLAKTVNKLNATAVESKIWSYICRYPATPSASLTNISKADAEAPPKEHVIPCPKNENNESMYDSTGMFHWVPLRTMGSATVNRKKAATATFKRHIVVCVLSQEKSQIIGLSSFIFPLRSSVIPAKELLDIVVLGDPKFLEKEWKYLYNLPGIYIVKGTALNRSDLRAVNLNSCTMCVILGAPNSAEKVADPSMLDKAVVLATLNVRAMRFSKDEGRLISGTDESDTTPDLPAKPLLQRQPALSTSKTVNSLQIPLDTRPSLTRKISQRPCPNRTSGYEVPIITDLVRDSNVMFLDEEDTDLPGTEFYMTQPYCCGRAFAASVLDLLMITSFFNPTLTKVIHTIIFGGASLELERIMAEGAGLIGGENISKPADVTNQVSVIQEEIREGSLSSHVGSAYGGLFVDALNSMGLVTLGLYRKLSPDSPKRYVICNPPESFPVQATDQIFALKRANWQWQPPLKQLQTAASSRNRIIDLDVRLLKDKLSTISQDVLNVQGQYENLIVDDDGAMVFRKRTTTGTSFTVPLVLSENGSIMIDDNSDPEGSDTDKNTVEEDIISLEHKLATMKRDVRAMENRYLRLIRGSFSK